MKEFVLLFCMDVTNEEDNNSTTGYIIVLAKYQ